MGNFILTFFSYSAAITIILAGILMVVCLATLPFWLLWNWLMPTIFGLPELTLLQSAGLWLMMMLIRSTRFDWKETFGETNKAFNKDNVKWDDVFVSIKKNYMA